MWGTMLPGFSRAAWRRVGGGLVLVLLVASRTPTAHAIPLDEAGAPMSIRYVDQRTCSPAGAGTAERPFCTIGQAAAVATAGTEVLVAAGTYQEEVKPASGAPGSPITFSAAPGATVVVTGAAHGFSLSGRSWVTISGFTITGTTDDGISAVGSAHLAIQGNRVSDVAGSGVQLTSTTDSRVTDNTIERTLDHGIYLTCQVKDGAVLQSSRNELTRNLVAASARPSSYPSGPTATGIRLYVSSDNAVVANVTRDNQDSGIEIYGGERNVLADNASVGNGDHGIDVNAANDTRIVSNTVARNRTIAVNVDFSSGATLADNIIDTNPVGTPYGPAAIRLPSESVPGSTLDYDLINAPAGSRLIEYDYRSYTSLATFRAATGQAAHGIVGDPLFVDSAAGNVTLRPGSPAVDSALSGLAGAPTTDAFGGRRVDDLGTPDTGAGPRSFDDRGAYELRNPGFETNLAGFNSAGSSAGVGLEHRDGGHSGAGSVAVVNRGTTAATCTLNDSPNWVATTAAGTYTATVWVRADQPGASVKLRLREWQGQTDLGQAKETVALSTQWQPVSVHYSARAPGASTLDLSAYVTAAAPGTCLYADDVSIALG
jgi:parallel beta-helix repeat protein